MRVGGMMRKAGLALAALLTAIAGIWAYGVFAEESAALVSLPFALGFGALFCAAAKALAQAENRRVQRLFSVLLIAMTALYLGASLWLMHAFRYTPVWDPEAVFVGAQNWLAGSLTKGSTPTFEAETYFYYFPNNLGAAFVLRTWFSLTRGMDAYISACMLNALLSAGMIACTGLAAKETAGARGGVLALLILGCTLPLWFSCAAFYTDFLSIGFPVGAYLFALKAQRQKRMWKKAAFWLPAGLAAAIGAAIKITVLIMPVALVLWQLLRGKWKEALGLLVACAVLFGAGQLILHRSVYPDQLDPEPAAKMNTPVQHWIAMGLNGDGYYNWEDYMFTRSFDDAREAGQALNGLIRQRIGEMGPAGLLEHMARKMGICLSDGTLMLSDYYDDTPVGPEWIKRLLLPGGSGYGVWRAACGGVHMAQIGFALAGCVGQMRRKRSGLSGAKYIALMGLMLFLSMWETSRRYWINFLPVLVLCAAEGCAVSTKGAWRCYTKGRRIRFFGERRQVIIRYKKRAKDVHTAANTFEAYDDLENYLGEAAVESMHCPMVFEKRPDVFTIRVQGDETACDALLGAATAHALFLAKDCEGRSCVRVEMQPGDAEKFGSTLEALGFTGKSAVLRMAASLEEPAADTPLPEGLTVVRDYLNDEKEREFYLERTNALFGTKKDMQWLSEVRDLPRFTRLLLIDEHGAAGEMLTWADGECGVIENLWVHPDWRGKGAGRYLMEFARAYWQERGIKTARMDVWSRLRPAVRLAYAAGFAPQDAVAEYPYMDTK